MANSPERKWPANTMQRNEEKKKQVGRAGLNAMHSPIFSLTTKLSFPHTARVPKASTPIPAPRLRNPRSPDAGNCGRWV
jgi:hypothetical protein